MIVKNTTGEKASFCLPLNRYWDMIPAVRWYVYHFHLQFEHNHSISQLDEHEDVCPFMSTYDLEKLTSTVIEFGKEFSQR